VDNGLWSFNVVVNPAGTATELQATYNGASPPIPEPASLALLTAAGVGIFLRPRKARAKAAATNLSVRPTVKKVQNSFCQPSGPAALRKTASLGERGLHHV
jgi:hypothetical protein